MLMTTRPSARPRAAALALPLAALPLLAGLAACEMLPGSRTTRVATEYDAETFFETTSVFGSSFSADETRILMTSDATGVFNAYALPIAGADTANGALPVPQPLTASTTSPLFGVRWFPDDDRAVLTGDQGGNELDHVLVRERDGSLVDVTPGDKHRADFAGFTRDGKTLFVQTNQRDDRFMDVYRCAVPAAAASGRSGDYALEVVFRNEKGFSPAQISGDGRWLALQLERNNVDNDLFLVDLAKDRAEPVRITPHEGNVVHSPSEFSPDSKTFYYVSNEGGEFDAVWSYDIATGKRAKVYAADWDVTGYDFSWNGEYLVIAVNADARTELTVLDTRTNEPVELPEMPRGDIRGVQFSKSGRLMLFSVSSDVAPTDLYVLDMESRDVTRLTRSLNPAIDENDLVEAEVVRYPSFDGLEIPAILYMPHGASTDAQVPAVVYVHGGPGGQTRVGYSADVQFLVNHGYAVLGVNNRGSSGYGKTFYHLDDRRHGDVDLKDCVWARRWLEAQDQVDGGRVAIMGGSYGGYMVAAALAFEPDAFDAGIDIFGVTNWPRTLTNIPPWWESYKQALYDEMGDPATDAERLHAISPLFHAANITKPLLVVQGANDPRVLQTESDELVAAARKNGVPVEYLLFPDEGHGFRNRDNRIAAAKAYLSFLDTWLKGTPAAP